LPSVAARLNTDVAGGTGDTVMTSRKLEDIASNLDDMSITLEEIKEEIASDDPRSTDKLDQIQNDMERAADKIDDSLTHQPPDE
jgi:hypothetical protein